MAEQTKIVNVFNPEIRKIKCIQVEHDYLGDGTIFKEEELELGKEYTFIKGEGKSYGLMVFLKEVPKEKYGFQSYLFEELEPYDKEILKNAYEDWLLSELDRGMQSIKNKDEVRK